MTYSCFSPSLHVPSPSLALSLSPPPDLNATPSPPRNVAFAILSNTDNTRPEVILQVRWAVQDCETTEIPCVEVLGYIIICQDRKADEIRRVVWRNEVEEFVGSIANVNFSVKPFSEYLCFMAGFNSYGMGFFGTRSEIVTDRLGKQLHSEIHRCV